MDRFFEYFAARKHGQWNGRVFLPVVHVESGNEFETGYRGAVTAFEAGADGVFLIEMTGATYHGKMTEVVRDIRDTFAKDGIDFAIGVNYLNIAHEPDLPIYEAVRLGNIPMIWSDNPYGRQHVEGARAKVGWDGLYFGAVAFKYQAPVSIEDLPGVAQAATWMDVPTTSGDGTGVAIDLEKAQVFSGAIPHSAKGIASGVCIENIDQILPYFNAILASTSINQDFHTLDPKKTKELADAISNWQPEEGR
jgi:hypothetical protein